MKPFADFQSGGVAVAEPVVTTLQPHDFARACELLRNEPTVCFQDWEERLLPQLCRDSSDLLPAYYEGGELLGILVAGTFGVRGTISHVAVAPHARGRKIATRLVDAALAALKLRGIWRVFLFTTPGNTGAEAFWLTQGFTETAQEKTFETNLA